MRGAILIEELELAVLRENESMEGGLALHADLFLNVKIPLCPRHQSKSLYILILGLTAVRGS